MIGICAFAAAMLISGAVVGVLAVVWLGYAAKSGPSGMTTDVTGRKGRHQ